MNINRLWQQYKRSKDREVRNTLINHYIPLVRITAGRLKSTITAGSVELDDLVSYGVLGLIDAIDKFDLEKNVKFETYAQMRIRGAMIDQLRKIDWAPRSLRQKSKEVEEAYRILENRNGRSASDVEVAEYLDMSLEEFQELLGQLSSLSLVSLEEVLENRLENKAVFRGEEGFSSRLSEPESIAEDKEVKYLLRDAIDKLPEREKLLITLYYYEELTYKEIGRIMGISESRVSQLHTKAVFRLKNNLNRHENDLIL
ncbi:MAG: RNA polymerase sigma factor for flagellar operon [Firmicutes bacterium]|nr:RNA polymerase sigma factor for flagellar operon [Bacillota bacterium]MDI6704697.1 FliA/WhiG family RNA polymerase sigma factor [Bacillota bacterium]